MRITPELIAKLIFSVSQLRYFEQQAIADPLNPELFYIANRWQDQVDNVLKSMGVEEYIPLAHLEDYVKLEQLKHAI
jgi:hypothetical protein